MRGHLSLSTALVPPSTSANVAHMRRETSGTKSRKKWEKKPHSKEICWPLWLGHWLIAIWC